MKSILTISITAALLFAVILTVQADRRRLLMTRAVAGGAAAATFTDDFIRANASPMSTTSSSGGTWSSGPGSAIDCNIDGNRLVGGGFWSMAAVSSPTFAGDQSMEITLTNSTAFNLIAAVVRMQSGTSTGYGAYLESAGGDMYVQKITDTGSVTLTAVGALFSTGHTWVSGDRIKITASGTSTTTLTVYTNGVQAFQRTDSSSPHTGGQPGVLLANDRRLHKVQADDL